MTEPTDDGSDLAGTIRAQSEVTGIVLLTAVIVILVSISGAYVITNVPTDSSPNLSIDAEVTSQNVTVSHRNGDRIETADLEILLRTDSSERYKLSTFTQLRGTDETRFEPGDRWYRSHGLDADRIEILVVHTPSNDVIERTTVDVTQTLAARIDYSPPNPSTQSNIEFDASDSFAFDGDIDSYEWEFGDGKTATTTDETVQYSYDDAGTYDVTLTVRTADGRTATRAKTIEILSQSLRADFTYSPTNPGVGEQIVFDASGSESPGGEIVEYRWAFGDGTATSTTSETIEQSYGSSGTYTAELTIEDDQGETIQATEEVTVSPGSLFASVSVDDIVQDSQNTQRFSFELGTALAAGESVTIDLSTIDDTVEYSNSDNRYTVVSGSGSATSGQKEQNDLLDFVYESNGDAAGEEIVIEVSDVDSRDATVYDQFDVRFQDDQSNAERQTSFSILPDIEVVDVDPQDSDVVEGDPLDVAVTVRNNADATRTQDVTLEADPEQDGIYETVGTQRVSVDAGASKTVTYTYNTDVGDAREIEFLATSEDDTRGQTATATIDMLPYYDVVIEKTNSPVREFEQLNVTVTVTNVGDLPGSQTITLRDFYGNFQDENTNLELDGGESQQFNLTWMTGFDAGTDDISVESDDETETQEVTIESLLVGGITITETNSPVDEGEQLAVTAEVSEGFVTTPEEVTLEIDGVEEDSTTVSPNDEVTLEWGTARNDAGGYNATVRLSGTFLGVPYEIDSDTDSVTVTRPQFNVTELAVPDTAEPGETIQATATIENTGLVTDTQNITYQFDGTDRNSTTLTLDSGNQQTVTLNYTVPENQPFDSYDHSISTDTNSTTESITVALDPAEILEFRQLRTGNNVLTFDIEHNGTDAVTVQEVAIDARNIDSGITVETSTSSNEISIGLNGYARTKNKEVINADRTRYDLEQAAEFNQGQYADILPGTELEVDIREFSQRLDNGDRNPLEQTTEPTEADVTVIFGLADGPDQVYYFKQSE